MGVSVVEAGYDAGMRHNIALVILMVITFVVGFVTQSGAPTLSIGAFVTSGLALISVLVLNAVSYMYPQHDE